MTDLLTFTEPTLRVVPWVQDNAPTAHDPRDDYAELFWLPSIGPSALWLLRRLARYLDEFPEGFEIDLREFAFQIGLGNGTSRQSPFRRAFERLVLFDLAAPVDGNVLYTRKTIPSIGRRQLMRLPSSLRDLHDKWKEPTEERESVADMRSRAFHLALSLKAAGTSDDEIIGQMTQWHFHPAIIHEAISRAASLNNEQPVA